jgi:hypothetical protein
MGHALSYVAEAAPGCRIYRETTGRYVVKRSQDSGGGQRVATLACAYATCQELMVQEMGEEGCSTAESTAALTSEGRR